MQRISNKLQTPNIVRIFECFETPNNIYIILEYCNGKTLADILKVSKTLPEKDSLIIIYQIALALQVMAAEDIAHRDIKPENIFINDGVYKVGDFGFASQKKLFQTTLGTYPYMAPEIFQNKDYDAKVDVWAVGVMLHEMLFGELYFIGNSHMEVATNVQNKKYVIRQPCNLSRELQDLLNKCLEKNPHQRLSATDLINHKAFDNIRNLPYFKPKSAIMSPEAQQVQKELENRLKAVYFLQNLGERVGASFPRFYLWTEAIKQWVPLIAYFLGETGPLALSISEPKRQAFRKSKFYDDMKVEAQRENAVFGKRYQEFIQEFGRELTGKYPNEAKTLVFLVNNAFVIDVEELYRAELLSRRMIMIRMGDEEFQRGRKNEAKEKLTMAYELTLASDIGKLIQEQFDFGKFEAGKANFNLEELLRQVQ